MAQIDEIKTVCARLAGMGWQNLFKRQGLDITKADFATELSRELSIDRSVPGFEDFTLTGKRGIEPGLPAASLLYHAFACPDVHPTATGEPATSVDAYPTLAELDSIENYAYSLPLSGRPTSRMSSSACLHMNTDQGRAPPMAITRILRSPARGLRASAPLTRFGTGRDADFVAILPANRELP